ncbi:hypothetical protein GCM10027443_10690 [Pontibacter brevis]
MLPSYADVSALAGKTHPMRQQEWLASRVLVYELLRHITPEPLVLARDENGKPYFPDQPLHLSLTHSPHLAAVIVSGQHQVGIDIELITPKALRVADKFLTEAEKQYTASDETATCLYWSAKETLYKLYSRKKLVLKENLLVRPGKEPNVLQGRVQIENFSKLYQIHHATLQEHVLTYCIDSD